MNTYFSVYNVKGLNFYEHAQNLSCIKQMKTLSMKQTWTKHIQHSVSRLKALNDTKQHGFSSNKTADPNPRL